MSYDVRAVANFVLDLAERDENKLTNMHINKIVYFLHAEFLIMFSRPLVSAKIEAWTHGPVFRELYREFKVFEDRPITVRAKYLDPVSGEKKIAQHNFTIEEKVFLEDLAKEYIIMTASALRAQSHITGGPWDQIWNHETNANASMKISDELIKSWYKRTAKH